MAQVETDGAESWMETETEDEDCETKDEDEHYDYMSDDSDESDDISQGEMEYRMSITPLPHDVWLELSIGVQGLAIAVQNRYLDEAANKLSYLQGLRYNGCSELNRIYKQDLECEICKGSLLVSVITGDRNTFTQKIDELKEFYLPSANPHPSRTPFTLMRLNLVKLLLDDDDARFDAAIDFLVETHFNFFREKPIFFRLFTVREIVNFLGADISMESSSVEAVVLGDIIHRCVNNLPAYMQKNGLEWEVREFLESARDKWKKKKTGFLISSCEKEPLEDLSRKQLIYEALAYLWFLLEDTQTSGIDRSNSVDVCITIHSDMESTNFTSSPFISTPKGLSKSLLFFASAPEAMSDNLPDDIFARLPAEDLVPCTAVCKEWYSVIRNQGKTNSEITYSYLICGGSKT